MPNLPDDIRAELAELVFAPMNAYQSLDLRLAPFLALLERYGEACAARERQGLLRAAQETVTAIYSTTVVNPSAPGYDGGKRVGAADVYSALVNSDPATPPE